MLIRAVIVGINHWLDLTEPFVRGLLEHNPGLDLVVVDNGSHPPYPGDHARLDDTLGYAQALNLGAEGEWDWMMCLNNDCTCDGEFEKQVAKLDRDTVYGNAWKYDYDGMKDGLPAVADSAYFLIPRKVWNEVGGFDPKMDAAFEEIDYQIRVLDEGYRIDVVELPITHLNLHTRWELQDYSRRWSRTRDYFRNKHPKRDTNVGASAQEV